MTKENKDTIQAKSVFILKSENDLVVEAGGAMYGFGGVVLHNNFTVIEDEYPSDEFGVKFSYSEVARIKIDGKVVWVNNKLPDAPTGRQDVLKMGKVAIELFEGEAQETLEKSKEMLKELGLTLSEETN